MRVFIAVAFIAATAFVPAEAGAKPKVIYGHKLPPPQYDGVYTGELRIWRVVSSERLRELNSPGSSFGELNIALAFSKISQGDPAGTPHKRCDIYIANDNVLKRYGASYSGELRHELGHCNGWGQDHAGGKTVPVSREVEIRLPPGTQTLRAYPPLVCLTPDGREETCADRSAKPNVADRIAKPNVKVAQAETPSPQQPTDPWTKSIQKREGYRFAPSGKLLMLDALYGAKLDCTSYMPVDVKIAPPPKHGTIELPTEEFVMQGWADSNPRAKCNGKNATGTYIKYKSDDGYKGPDAFTVFAIWPNGTASEWKYTIDVR